MRGGSYLVARRIRMLIESWDRASLGDQQQTIGRHKASGAPLTGTPGARHPRLRRQRRRGAGDPGRRPRPARRPTRRTAAIKILRRGYSYTDGMDAETGQLDAGLFFIAYQKDPAQFIALQRKLGVHDALNEYIKHTGSALFACPPGVARGASWGDPLFGVTRSASQRAGRLIADFVRAFTSA